MAKSSLAVTASCASVFGILSPVDCPRLFSVAILLKVPVLVLGLVTSTLIQRVVAYRTSNAGPGQVMLTSYIIHRFNHDWHIMKHDR